MKHYLRHFPSDRRTLLSILGAVLGIFIIVQLLYPFDRQPLFASIDGVNVSGWKQADATWELNQRANTKEVPIHIGKTDDVYTKASPRDMGVRVEYERTVNGYPWYMRLVPTSLLWYGFVPGEQTPAYKANAKTAETFLAKKLGTACKVPPKNASLTFKDGTLQLVPAVNGGTCQKKEAVNALTGAKPKLSEGGSVTIPVTVEEPNVKDEAADALAKKLKESTKDGVKLTIKKDTTKTISQKVVLSWLIFKPKGDELTFSIDPKKANDYMAKEVAPLVTKPAGTTKIATRDFTVISTKKGQTGQAVNTAATFASITQVIDEEKPTAQVQVASVKPKVSYTRSYTKTSTGIAALLSHFDQDNAGVFGVSFQELGGQGRAAAHNSSRTFVTASTYKLYVAYGTLQKIDKKTWKWSDANIAGGRSLATCFDDMIVKSDNACAEALLKKLGFKALTNDIRALGLTGSSFLSGDTPSTNARDLGLFLQKLQTGSLPIGSTSESKLISAMKRNVYRQGVPAGASGQVANKVGFLWGLLHDASIVYSPKGTYVLVVLTDGSSWGKIAEITRKIESLR